MSNNESEVGQSLKQIIEHRLEKIKTLKEGGVNPFEYTENMLRFSDATKNNLEENTDFPTNLVMYIGYSFWV